MKINQKEAALLDKAIDKWEENALINPDTAHKLRASYESDAGDYKSLTFYAFIAAVSCALLAFGALVLDEKWIERMRRYFAFSEITIGLIFAALTVVLIFYIRKRKRKFINTVWANESLCILLGLSASVAVAYFGKGFSMNTDQYYWLIFATGAVLGYLAFAVQSRLLWIAMLLTFGGWWAAYTETAATNHGAFFWGMNMPLRLTLYGLLVLLVAYAIRRIKPLADFAPSSYFTGWILFLFTAWGLSISGNYSFQEWTSFRQSRVLFWAIGYTVVLVGILLYAVKRKDNNLRDMALLFLLLNLYTRYFEYFWDVTNKGIFFTILALSFWLIGRKLEQYRKKTERLDPS
ncbi:hypothetical protein DBR32_06700 [Taibaiella sp. KBW10]|uniref:hypothetical protein n=1 Tax=Taibaiella sp. KBW10 TaxID=2153357 RepID=UPI000F594536|nr:hypothetical protein [Taibaiella sp. KBW10]RQO31636.1 hypothetical protein DBR32_06700 [Taibaiella sp. KBW10]